MSIESFTDLITGLRFSGKPLPNKYIDELVNVMTTTTDTIVEKHLEAEKIAKADLVIITLFITSFSNTFLVS
jgi:hypothetical protein